MLNNLYQIIVQLNTLTHPLTELLQKYVVFDWTETCNETFVKLKLCINNDYCLSIWKNLYMENSSH